VPAGLRTLSGQPYDLSAGRRLGPQHLDDAYTDVGRVQITSASLGTVEVWRDDSLPWLQAFTAPERDSIALEPCSCPPDAFRSGTDLVVLEPGHSHRARWGVTVTEQRR